MDQYQEVFQGITDIGLGSVVSLANRLSPLDVTVDSLSAVTENIAAHKLNRHTHYQNDAASSLGD